MFVTWCNGMGGCKCEMGGCKCEMVSESEYEGYEGGFSMVGCSMAGNLPYPPPKPPEP